MGVGGICFFVTNTIIILYLNVDFPISIITLVMVLPLKHNMLYCGCDYIHIMGCGRVLNFNVGSCPIYKGMIFLMHLKQIGTILYYKFTFYLPSTYLENV